MSINITGKPTLPTFGDPTNFNVRAQALFEWLSDDVNPDGFIYQLENIDLGDYLSVTAYMQTVLLAEDASAARSTLDLGNAATETVQDSATDLTAGRIPKLGNDADFDDLTVATLLVGGGNNEIDITDQRVAWTPELASTGGGESVTYNAQAGQYFRYGDLCIAIGRIDVATVANGSGNTRLAGLPFTASSSVELNGLVGINNANSWNTQAPETGGVIQNTTQANLAYFNGAGIAVVPWSNVQANAEIRFVVIYVVN